MKTPLQKIRRWLSDRGYKLSLRKGLKWRVNFKTKVVTGDPYRIDERVLKKNEKIALLLHECGHIDRNGFARILGTPWDNAGELVPLAEGAKPKTSWYIATVQEEIDAWNAGYLLSRRLMIAGLDKAIKNIRSICLVSYFRWAADKGDYKDCYAP